MYYINSEHIRALPINWSETIAVIEEAVRILAGDDFAQPIKPYLRFRDLNNRIIAMPAFLGGPFNIAGIKWIASFPRNIEHNIPRAHSVVILNEADTGIPVCIINTALLSIIRTASVSGLLIDHYMKIRPLSGIKVGIIGWGPIGRNHFQMTAGLLNDKVDKYYLYDLKAIDLSGIPPELKDKVVVAASWQQAYTDADIFMTCTVADAPYINLPPKKGSLQLNVSLRDYMVDIYDHVDVIIVDDWDEVCRQNTDIEMMHKEKGLTREETKSLIDVVCGDCLAEGGATQTIMFNPMGMAVFDLAMGKFYLERIQAEELGLFLD